MSANNPSPAELAAEQAAFAQQQAGGIPIKTEPMRTNLAFNLGLPANSIAVQGPNYIVPSGAFVYLRPMNAAQNVYVGRTADQANATTEAVLVPGGQQIAWPCANLNEIWAMNPASTGTYNFLTILIFG